MARWIDIDKIKPVETGEYKCRDITGKEFPAFYVKTGGGTKVFMGPNENLIIQYWYHEPNWTCKDCGGGFMDEPITCICNNPLTP